MMSQIKEFFNQFSKNYDDTAFFSSIGTLYVSRLEEIFILSKRKWNKD